MKVINERKEEIKAGTLVKSIDTDKYALVVEVEDGYKLLFLNNMTLSMCEEFENCVDLCNYYRYTFASNDAQIVVK